jgi:flagellar hook-associated protein 3 FlgL
VLAAEQYERNGELLGSRLGLQESALADVGDILMRVRELAVQGGNGALDQSARRLIATEVRTNLDQLMQIGNRKAPSGEHLFAGASIGSAPFVRQGGAVQYAGDELQRFVEVAPGQRIADSLPGSEVFFRIPAGNGTFALRADVGNAGTAVVGQSSVADTAAWDGEPYRILFMANGDWEARDAADALVASGPYAAGDAIEFKGIRVTVSGAPVAGDQLQVRVYEKVRSADTQRVIEEWILTGAQSKPIFVTPPLTLKHGWDFTLDKLAGTDRTITSRTLAAAVTALPITKHA